MNRLYVVARSQDLTLSRHGASALTREGAMPERPWNGESVRQLQGVISHVTGVTP